MEESEGNTIDMMSSSMQLPTVLDLPICFHVIVFVLDTDRKETNCHCCVMFTLQKDGFECPNLCREA